MTVGAISVTSTTPKKRPQAHPDLRAVSALGHLHLAAPEQPETADRDPRVALDLSRQHTDVGKKGRGRGKTAGHE
jgi:hypothetical protein